MWRGLAATTGELVAYLDTDTEDFTPAFVLGLLGPLLTQPSRVRQGRVPAPVPHRRDHRSPTAAGASRSSSRGRT